MAYVRHEILLTVSQPGRRWDQPLKRGEDRAILLFAHQDMIRAATIYRGHVELTRSLMGNSISQAYLGDAEYQLLIKGCHIAAADLAAALHAVAPLGPGGASTTVQALQAAATASYQSKCASNP